MKMLSEDDLDLAGMSDEELAAAWDLWFDLAQATNEHDPPWTHGVFIGLDPAGHRTVRSGAPRGEMVGGSAHSASAGPYRQPLK